MVRSTVHSLLLSDLNGAHRAPPHLFHFFLRMIEIAKAMRLKISKRKVTLADGREEDHRLGTLSVPLPPALTSDRQSKRKKMN